jgi:hypothetical protein
MRGATVIREASGPDPLCLEAETLDGEGPALR